MSAEDFRGLMAKRRRGLLNSATWREEPLAADRAGGRPNFAFVAKMLGIVL